MFPPCSLLGSLSAVRAFFRRRGTSSLADSLSGSHAASRPVLVLLEGPHDLEFLRRISRVLAAKHSGIPDLRQLERTGQIVLLPLGGNEPQPWMEQLTPLGRATFCLFDRELPPISEQRWQAVSHLNVSGRCQAFLTAKRSLENYLHPRAIWEAQRIRLAFGDQDDVAGLAAEQLFAQRTAYPWQELPLRTRKRFRDQAKRWLNRAAVDRMTAPRLAERDPEGEVRNWLQTIAELVAASR